uniref:Prion-related protein testis-specific n=1 Tax=Cervus elaphus TaxID=9860 RepID=A4ULE7_CEREL|nr:prion-related protein testis-specific [Cervus elaphus]
MGRQNFPILLSHYPFPQQTETWKAAVSILSLWYLQSPGYGQACDRESVKIYC